MGGLQPVSNKGVTIMCFAWRTLLAKANMPNESESRYAPSLVLLMRGQRAMTRLQPSSPLQWEVIRPALAAFLEPLVD